MRGDLQRRAIWIGRGLVLVAAAFALSCNDSGSGSISEGQEGTPLADAKLIIEHNSTDDDTGFQIFVDGEPWSSFTVEGPAGQIVQIDAQGPLQNFGLTEGFLETNEPAAADMSMAEVLSLLPAGRYNFSAVSSRTAASCAAPSTSRAGRAGNHVRLRRAAPST